MEQDAQVDCAEKLSNAKRDIKVLNYQLSHIVAGINDKSNTLIPRYPTDIEIMEETHMSYKVNARSQYCPVRVLIHYNENNKLKKQPVGDLKVYVSFTNKDPNETDHIRSYVNVTSFLLNMLIA